jgi:hypothetical protein
MRNLSSRLLHHRFHISASKLAIALVRAPLAWGLV